MRDALACPACSGRAIYEVAGVRAHRFGGTFVLPVARRVPTATGDVRAQVASWRSESYGQWRVFVCADCRLVEWYVDYVFADGDDNAGEKIAAPCRRCAGTTAWRALCNLNDKSFEVRACVACGLADWRWLDAALRASAPAPRCSCGVAAVVHGEVPQLVGRFGVTACTGCGRCRWRAHAVERLTDDRRARVTLHEPSGPYR